MSQATPSQRALLQRLKAALDADERVESAWLSGSFGEGRGDAWSDIDITAVVDEEDLPHCLAEYAGPRSPVGETVLLRALFGRIAHGVAPDWERFDILFLTSREFRARDKAGLKPLAPESLDAAPPPSAPSPAASNRPDAAALGAATEEFLRVLGLTPGVIGREEWLVAQEGVGLQRKALIELMFEANGLGRAQRGGAKRINAYLTDAQRAAVEAVPAPACNRAEVIAATAALAAIFMPLAKELLAEAGAPWPQALEDATRRHVERTIGLTF